MNITMKLTGTGIYASSQCSNVQQLNVTYLNIPSSNTQYETERIHRTNVTILKAVRKVVGEQCNQTLSWHH